MRHSNKTIVIAGADGALGGAALEHFARAGARVIGTAYSPAGAERLRKKLTDSDWHGNIHRLDMGDYEACGKFAAEVTSSNPRIDGILNAAGGFRYTSTEDCSLADFNFLLNANFISCWHLAKFFVPFMKKQTSGRLVFVSSRKTKESGQANFGIYTATKAALDAMVGGLAQELKSSGLTVNMVAPSVIDTPANRVAMPDSDFSKWVTTEDILNAVDFLFSDEAAAMNGTTITVSGGA